MSDFDGFKTFCICCTIFGLGILLLIVKVDACSNGQDKCVDSFHPTNAAVNIIVSCSPGAIAEIIKEPKGIMCHCVETIKSDGGSND